MYSNVIVKFTKIALICGADVRRVCEGENENYTNGGRQCNYVMMSSYMHTVVGGGVKISFGKL